MKAHTFAKLAQLYGTDHAELDLNPEADLRGAIEEFAYYSDAERRSLVVSNARSFRNAGERLGEADDAELQTRDDFRDGFDFRLGGERRP